MKTQGFHRRTAGFSLMELIVVVSIIVVLAGLTMTGFNFVNQKKARDQATVQLKLIEQAIQNYHLVNRAYPTHLDPQGDRGDEALFKALYWDPFIDRQNGGRSEIFLAELDPDNHSKSGQKWIQGQASQARIVDPWGNPYRYRSGDSPGAINPDFDLWSAGPDGKSNGDPKHNDSLDDIR